MRIMRMMIGWRVNKLGLPDLEEGGAIASRVIASINLTFGPMTFRVESGRHEDDRVILLEVRDVEFHHLLEASQEVRLLLNEEFGVCAHYEFVGNDVRYLNYLLSEMDRLRNFMLIMADNIKRTRSLLPGVGYREIGRIRKRLEQVGR